MSIFMSLTLTLMLSLCLVLIQGARQNTVRLEAEYITDIGMNSVLAEYHREVLKQYNLFFVDCSYGTQHPSFYNTEARLRMYLEKNVAGREALGILAGNGIWSGIYMDLLELEFPEVKVTGVSLASDNQGFNFQKQAIQAVKSDIGIGAIEEIMSWIEVVEQKHLQDSQLDEQMNAVEKQLAEMEKKRREEIAEKGQESMWNSVKIENPVSGIVETKKAGILSWVLGSPEKLSSKAVISDQYISKRRDASDVNLGNIYTEAELTVYERLLFQEYLFRYAGCYLKEKEDSALDYQIEYMLFGKNSDVDNLGRAVAAICGMRETANLMYLSASAQKREAIAAAAAVLSAAILAPETEPVFEGAILIGWSILESIQDIKILLDGGKVPLLKDDASWNCSIENIFDLDIGEKEEATEGLAYADYLRLFMYLADLETITYRFMDIMEMDIRRTEGNRFFRMDGCIDYLEVQVNAVSGYGYEYELKHAKGYR